MTVPWLLWSMNKHALFHDDPLPLYNDLHINLWFITNTFNLPTISDAIYIILPDFFTQRVNNLYNPPYYNN